jgi:hypothetical protein
MTKLLKALVVILLILTVCAFTFGAMLFHKREILKGRTQKLERAFMALAATIEDEPPVLDRKPEYPARDIDDATSELLDSPRRSRFWHTFRHELELPADSTLDLSARRAQLMRYYRIDPFTLNPVVDPGTGRKLTDGPGTMQEVINYVVREAEKQLDLLNATRDQLSRIRNEFVKTIAELNTRKQDLRLSLNTVVQRDDTIVELTQDISSRDRQIDGLEKQAMSLEETIREREASIERKDDKICGLSNDVSSLKLTVAQLIKGTPRNEPYQNWNILDRGHKGTVGAVNGQWEFVLLKLTDEFVNEYNSAIEKGVTAGDPDLTIMRDVNGQKVFVSKVKLTEVRPQQRVGVAEILTAWKQMDINEGDEVLY